MKNKTKLPKPFLKWAGGKTKIIPHIIPLLPNDNINYLEPFLGGGALFFELSRTQKLSKAIINDSNRDLINVYKVIKYSVNSLIEELDSLRYKNTQADYLKIRSHNPLNLSAVKAAARFIYLNRTCFNGLFRVNKKGFFNVPYGKYANPIICDRENLKAVHLALENTSIHGEDYIEFSARAKSGDYVYFDPPYLPISKSSNFTEYTDVPFGIKEHELLRELIDKLTTQGVKCIISNSYCDQTLALYQGYNVRVLEGNRNVGGSSDSRKKVKEILVTNY